MSSLLHAHLPPLVPAALVTAAELGPAWLQRCMTRDFGERHIPRRLGVALSGGADSTALAHMAALWAREEPKTRSLVAFHVNHNVRANSGAEQQQVLQLMKARAVETHPLAIDWPKGIKPTGGKLQLACREQRYTLLDQAARQHNIDTMLVGHHLNDQAETLLLRLSRSTGLRGLSAMRAVVPLVDYGAEPHIALWRPSLDIRKRELIAYCQAHSLEWIHDPSNDNFHFRRVYARRLVDTLETAFDCPPEEFAATSRLADTLDQVLEHAATEFLDNYGTYREPTSASRRRWQSRDSQTTADFIKSQDAKPTLEPIMVAGDIFLSLPSQVAIRVLNRYDESLSSGAALAFIRTAHDRRKKFHERVLPELIVPLNSQFAIRFLKPRRYSQAPYKRRAVRVMAPRYPDSRQYDTRNESSNN